MGVKEFKRMEKQVESCLSSFDLMSLAAFGTKFKGFHDTAKAQLVSVLKQNTQTDKWRCVVRPQHCLQQRQRPVDPNNM